MFERLKRFFRGKDEAPDPRNQGGWDIVSGVPGWTNAGAIWSEKLNATKQNLETLNGQQTVVYSCVRRIVLAAQEAALRIGRDTPKGWEDLDGHDLLSLLRRPNPHMGANKFLSHYLMHLLLTGDSYLWKWRNKAGYITELWPMPTSWVSPVLDQAQRIVGYDVFQGMAGKKRVPLEDMARMYYPDPSSPFLALGPLQAALRDVRVDETRQDYQMEMLTNNRTPGMIMYQPEDWTDEQKQDVRAAIVKGLGDGNRGKTLFMQGEGAKVEQIAPVKELDWPGLTGLSETRICAAFGVPPIIVGLRAGLENATYSNYELALRAFYEGTMVPTWNFLGEELTRELLTVEGDDDGSEIYFETEGIKALVEDADKRATRAGSLFTAGLITRNEGRELAGLDALEPAQGDVFLLGLSQVEVPLAQVGQAPEKPPKDDGTATQNAE